MAFFIEEKKENREEGSRQLNQEEKRKDLSFPSSISLFLSLSLYYILLFDPDVFSGGK